MSLSIDEIVAKFSAIQVKLVKNANHSFRRFLWKKMVSPLRLVGIKGPRGAGKTTMLLQMIMEQPQAEQCLYVSLDHPLIYNTSLYQLAEYWSMLGGTKLYLDEVHKYPHQSPGWAIEVKAIYDAMPELSIVFTASSALELITAEADLSRRVSMYHLPGMSFREYLMLQEVADIKPVTIDDLIENHATFGAEILNDLKPLVHFRTYLKKGYLPFGTQLDEVIYHQQLLQSLTATLEVDLMAIEPTTMSGLMKMKQLLGIIAESAPFKPNISKIAEQMNASRDTVYAYLQNFERAQIINQLQNNTKGIAALQKPEKIYLENTNFCFALRTNPEIGNIRETFVINQLKNAGNAPCASIKGDLVTNEGIVFEVGGRSKGSKQLDGHQKGYLLVDDIETGFNRRIPLWMVGLLY